MARAAESIELELLLEAIRARYGYDFRDYSAGTIERRLRLAVARFGLPHFGELQHRVLHDSKLFHALLDELTVQVSDVFRDPDFYLIFRRRVVPVLRTYPELKIWHAGCAGGEEVYTTAIILLEENLYERTQLYATDISSRALDQAREGMYDAERAPSFAERYARAGGTRDFADYHSTAYGRIALHESLRKNMVFFQHDLVSDYALGEMHVILCRNVLIYFESALRERVLEMFSQGLSHGGFLCLGSSESLPARAAGFVDFAPQQRIYRYLGAGRTSAD